MEIQTERFLLRDFVDGDIAQFEAYHNDPRSQEFHDAGEARPERPRELVTRFQAWAAEQPRRNYQLAIVQRKSPHALIGCAGLREVNAPSGSAELGVELAPWYWGRYGYAIEVTRALVEFGFGILDLRKIGGRTVSANSRIARLADAFGATAVASRTPEWMVIKGWTEIEWQLTREQWEGGRLAKRYGRRANA
ncbi:MAG TPA: GNAT family protein [Noviherbaspirillum sp.]|nr:GNAT family protein [Noviherbaspirillum sp.]